MVENNTTSESDEGEVKSDFEEDFQEELYNFPHVLRFIQRMRDHIKKQNKKIAKLRNKINQHKKQLMQSKTLVDYGTQTNPLEHEKELCLTQDWNISNDKTLSTIKEQVTEVAEAVEQQTRFVYEETSGLFYDYNSGYYYDAKQGLYYNGNTGAYYYYDKASNMYHFHSQVTVDKGAAHDQNRKQRKTRKATKVSDDIHELVHGLSNISIVKYRHQALDLAKPYPPCMRIIVKETDLPKLRVGSLFIVPYTGGSLGREGDHSVLIPDINISKHHARFAYDEDKKIYEITDLGSRNGTFLNGKRLSVAKQESEPHEVSHGSIVQVGTTKLLCHIHNGNETCGHCEPGLVQQISNVEENKICKKEQHKQELRRLKFKFGVEKDNVAAASQLASGYQDRAQSRRQSIGSLNHHAKTQHSSMDTRIAKDNKGFKLLSKMGWSEGQSLGKEGDGRTEPVSMTNNPSKTGLGAASEFPTIELDSTTEKKQALWRKTQQRYKEINDDSE